MRRGGATARWRTPLARFTCATVSGREGRGFRPSCAWAHSLLGAVRVGRRRRPVWRSRRKAPAGPYRIAGSVRSQCDAVVVGQHDHDRKPPAVYGIVGKVQPTGRRPGPWSVTRTQPDVVLVESLTSGLYLEQEVDTRRFDQAFDHLRASALPIADSISLIERVIEGL
ncbi:Scr1 family TA system antitoxin-like transcriptional regulator [Sphaerisporangium sp. NPDC051011]|uniref:Scr1 family TA system antitoxin-like transcriptional regulator n=1 Tax=Sphaerisporangium sp. NPDC051011 TaxID=3155792 RepID=UPI0034115924